MLLILACAEPDSATKSPVDSPAVDSPAETAAPVDSVDTVDPVDTVDTTTPAETADTVDSVPPEPPPWGPYHPELTSWPRLVALPDDREVILARVAGTASTDPTVNAAWAELYADLVASCDSTAPVPSGEEYDYAAAWPAAAIARNCAMLAWLDRDTTRAERAAAILATIPTDASTLTDASYDVHLSTTLGLLAETYDLLRGSGQIADLTASRAVVLALTQSMFQRYVVDEPLWMLVWYNNHNLKLAGALGMAALVLNDEEDAYRWLSWSLTTIPAVLDSITLDGNYGEGFYYLAYASQELLPFLRAWHRLLGDTGETFAVECATTPSADCVDEELILVGDLWADEGLRNVWRVSREYRMPDGMRPPVDDGVPEGFPSGILSEIDPAYGWDWLTQSPRYVTWAGDSTAELLAAFDGSYAEPADAHVHAWDPADPSSGAGYAWVGTGRGADDTWAMVVAEPAGPATDNGHDHDDLGSIELWARGAWLLIDPGYAGYSERAYTSEAEDHSGLTIDGDAPPDDDPLYTEASDGADGPRVVLDVPWSGGAWQRTVAVRGEALVVEDEVTLDAVAALTWRWHLNSGGTSFEARDWGGLLTVDGVMLAIVGDGEVTLGQEIDEDALTYGTLLTHDVLTAETTADAAFVRWAFVPVDGEPTVERSDAGITVDGVLYTAA